MKLVRVDKERLIEVVENNRDQYIKDLVKAKADFLVYAEAQLKEASKELSMGKFYSVSVNIASPEDHTKEYTKILKKLELSVDTIIELTDTEFNQYINNEWNFVHHLGMMTASYK